MRVRLHTSLEVSQPVQRMQQSFLSCMPRITPPTLTVPFLVPFLSVISRYKASMNSTSLTPPAEHMYGKETPPTTSCWICYVQRAEIHCCSLGRMEIKDELLDTHTSDFSGAIIQKTEEASCGD